MKSLSWSNACELVSSYVVQIIRGSDSHGTGFIYRHDPKLGLSSIATAAHVVEEASVLGAPLQIVDSAGQKTTIFDTDRAVFADTKRDTALILVSDRDVPKIAEPLDSTENVKPGHEVGWMGFPAVADRQLSFFSGRVSAIMAQRDRLLVDGVALPGCSGSPVFAIRKHASGARVAKVMGVMTCYWPNLTMEDDLGLTGVSKLSHFDELKKKIGPFLDQLACSRREKLEELRSLSRSKLR